MNLSRRDCLRFFGASAAASLPATLVQKSFSQDTPLNRLAKSRKDLTIKEVRVTPIALPDPPLLAASGCHGPYYLRTIVELVTTDGVTGVGETGGGERAVAELKRAASQIVGTSALSYRRYPQPPINLSTRAFAAVEVACLDAIGKAT